MSGVQSLKEHLDRMTQELTQIKKIAIGLEERDKEKTGRAWDDLMTASSKIRRFGWKPRNRFKEGIKETVEHHTPLNWYFHNGHIAQQ